MPGNGAVKEVETGEMRRYVDNTTSGAHSVFLGVAVVSILATAGLFMVLVTFLAMSAPMAIFSLSVVVVAGLIPVVLAHNWYNKKRAEAEARYLSWAELCQKGALANNVSLAVANGRGVTSGISTGRRTFLAVSIICGTVFGIPCFVYILKIGLSLATPRSLSFSYDNWQFKDDLWMVVICGALAVIPSVWAYLRYDAERSGQNAVTTK